MKQMKVGDRKLLTLTARLTDSKKYLRYIGTALAKKDETFSLIVSVREKL